MDVLVGTQKIPLDFTIELEEEKLDEKAKLMRMVHNQIK